MPSLNKDQAAGCYVHVPFCASKCRYCTFYSETAHFTHTAWADAVLREARLLAPSFSCFDSLYLGGGTPSLLSDDLLELLLLELRRALPMCEDVEVSIELNPGDVDLDRARRLRAMGIDRVSLGVQSFDNAVLRFLGRRHDRACALRALDDLRSAGFDNLGLDLIWGIPDHTSDQMLRSVRQALAFQPEHLSCYSLTIEAGTPLHRLVEQGAVRKTDEDALADEAELLWSRLAEAGYDHYEVSNFARTHAHRSRHNSKYWKHVPYLGLGPSAHSFDAARRWENVRSVRKYVDALCARQRGLAFHEVLTDEQISIERVMLGLRTSDGLPREWVDESRIG